MNLSQQAQNQEEHDLLEHLRKTKQETDYIYMSLHPDEEHRIMPQPVNKCKVEARGNVREFKHISETFYDAAIWEFDKRCVGRPANDIEDDD